MMSCVGFDLLGICEEYWTSPSQIPALSKASPLLESAPRCELGITIMSNKATLTFIFPRTWQSYFLKMFGFLGITSIHF